MSNATQERATAKSSTDQRLAGKVAVVTGASSGIGEATARELARLGASVVLAARRIEKLQAVVKDIEDDGGIAFPVIADTTNADELRQMVTTAVERYGRLDYAVNNAGAPGRGAFMDLTLEQFDKVLNTNLRGVFLAMQAEIPSMLKNGGGAIVNTASVGGLVGVPGLSSYAASKWAVIGLTKSVALEYATQGIRINAIAPGSTSTEMLASATDAQRDFLTSLAPMKRISEPNEIARGIVFLLADATYSTGIVLPADGGQSVP